MKIRSNLLIILLLSGLFLGFHVTALSMGLYWIFPFFDYGMHSIGGVIIGLVSMFVLKLYTNRNILILIFSMCFALSVILLWEYIEYSIGATYTLNMYSIDTLSDIAIGLAAAFLTVFVINHTHHE